MTLELPPMSAIAARARFEIERYADKPRAIEVSNAITDAALKQFNDAQTDFATSVLARAMFAQAMLGVASDWLADVTKMPNPESYRAILDLAVNRPIDVDVVSFKDDGR